MEGPRSDRLPKMMLAVVCDENQRGGSQAGRSFKKPLWSFWEAIMNVVTDRSWARCWLRLTGAISGCPMDLTSYTSNLSSLNNLLAQWLSDFNAQLPWGKGRACEMCISLSNCRISNPTDLGWGLEICILTGISGDSDAGFPAESLIPGPKTQSV